MLEVIDWCLRLDPLERPQSVFALQRAIRDIAPMKRKLTFLGESQAAAVLGDRRASASLARMRFTIFQESRKGAREGNQDRIAYTYSRETLLLVIADGMGGHVGGEIAAQIAVRLFIERFQQEAKPILRNPLKFLQDTMLRAHAALGSYANQFSMLETPRTTCVAVIVQGGHAYWAHVGDSRFYLLRQGKLIGGDEGSLEGAVPGRPGDHHAAGGAACIRTATRSSVAWAAWPSR